MQINGGNFQVLNDNGVGVGYWLSAKVSGKYYD